MRHPASFDFCPMSWRVCSRVLLALSLLAGLGWLCWKGARDAAIPLLPPGPGEWIVYPTPPQSGAYLGQAVSADFERQFVLGTPPAQAELSWRAFRQSGLSINGIALPEAGQAGRNWKDVSRMDAAPYLRRGTNTISATVWNDNGPPALSLRLEIHGAAVATDEGWGVSVAGAAWRPARPAAATPEFGEGNALHGLEETGPALRESRARLCVFLLVAIGLAGGLAHGMRRGAGAGGWNYWRWPALGLAAAWAVLFLHNSPLLPRDTGFDAPEHLKYISYVQEHRSLPAPDQGWEMYQPPLYYVLSACLLGVCHLDVSQPAGILLLRWWGALAGAANVALIFFCLRLIFPGQWTRQMAGALLAAFLPAQIYLLHYTTNETLAATLMSGAFYCCLRILRAPAAAAGWHAGLGCVLGLALLAKASAVLFLPVIFAVVAGKLILERQTAPGLWVRTVISSRFARVMVHRTAPGRRLTRSIRPAPLSATVATIGISPSRSRSIAATKRGERHSILPISSTRKTSGPAAGSSVSSTKRSRAPRSTPYRLMRCGEVISTCASTAVAPRKLWMPKPTRCPFSRISSVVKPPIFRPARAAAMRRIAVVLPIPGGPVRRRTCEPVTCLDYRHLNEISTHAAAAPRGAIAPQRPPRLRSGVGRRRRLTGRGSGTT